MPPDHTVCVSCHAAPFCCGLVMCCDVVWYAVQVSLEMETFHLLDLARCSEGNSLQAAAFCIAAAERYSNK